MPQLIGLPADQPAFLYNIDFSRSQHLAKVDPSLERKEKLKEKLRG
jgi:hypothetical protein